MNSTKLNRLCSDLQSGIDSVKGEVMTFDDAKQVNDLLLELMLEVHLAKLVNNPLILKLKRIEGNQS